MAETVIMPKLGFDMAEGTLVRWVKAEGEGVDKGQVLAEIETDKATVEVESSFSGTVLRHLATEGDVVPVGEPIAVIGEPGEEVESAKPSKEEIEEAGAEAAPRAFDQKAPAKEEKEDQREEPGMVGKVTPPEKDKRVKAEKRGQDGKDMPGGDGKLPSGLRASPLARRIADERGIELQAVEGSGPGGRITKKDVEAFLERPPTPAPEAAPARERPPMLMPAYTLAGPLPPDEEVPLSRLRAAVGRRMVESKQQAPHFYVTHEYDVERLLELRAQINPLLGEEEKISVNDFIVKALALTLRQFPNLNASLDGEKVIRHGAVNIGVAVAIEGGLLTVVCRDADRKPLRQISIELKQMIGRVRSGKVRPEDIEGSTFSLSNMGMFDVENFLAILNPPEAGILAVSSARQVPAVIEGEVRPAWRMKATISVDHRVSDGAEAARFLQAMESFLQEPLRLLV